MRRLRRWLNLPTVMRVLLLPYVGEDGELFDVRYSYMMINDFSWVTGEYLWKMTAEKVQASFAASRTHIFCN